MESIIHGGSLGHILESSAGEFTKKIPGGHTTSHTTAPAIPKQRKKEGEEHKHGIFFSSFTKIHPSRGAV